MDYTSDKIAATLNADDAVNSIIKSTEEFEGNSENEEKGGIIDYITSLGEKIVNGASTAIDKMKNIISDLIDALAILIICYCIIPVVSMIIILWLAKFLFSKLLVTVEKED